MTARDKPKSHLAFKPMSNFDFRAMSFSYKFRDFLLPRKNVLKEVGIKPRSTVLDYGCGPGSYVVATAERATPFKGTIVVVVPINLVGLVVASVRYLNAVSPSAVWNIVGFAWISLARCL